MFSDDLAKLAITIANGDSFCGYLVIYLQLDVSLLMQNSVKIRHYIQLCSRQSVAMQLYTLKKKEKY